MVHPMVDNFNNCKFVNHGTIMATGDKQQLPSVNKSSQRDLSSETRNTFLKSPKNSPLTREKTPIMDTLKVSNTQKQQSSCLPNPAHQPYGSFGINGHLVYVGRKLEQVKTNDSDCDSPARKKSRNDCTSEPKQQPNFVLEAKAPPLQDPTNVPTTIQSTSSAGSTLAHSNGMTINGLPVPASDCSRAPVRFSVDREIQRISAAIPIQAETRRNPASVSFQPELQRPRDQHWKERFDQLQMFLKACDQLNRDEYIHKLRSLSAADRSRHAYELEKRAIQLSLEEGKELYRVRILNVMNKMSAD